MIDARISFVSGGTPLVDVVRLLRDYATRDGGTPSGADLAAEIEALPGPYRPPGGALFLAARPDGQALGCVGLRPLDRTICEIRLLYVSPAARGCGLGDRLIDAALTEARRIGHRRVVADTAGSMASARKVWEAHGFRARVSPLRHPVEAAQVLGLDL